jgi:hypothetical protein
MDEAEDYDPWSDIPVYIIFFDYSAAMDDGNQRSGEASRTHSGDPMIPLMFAARCRGDFDLVEAVTILQQSFRRASARKA